MIFEKLAVKKAGYHGPLSGLKWIAKDVAKTAKNVGVNTALMYAASHAGWVAAPAITGLGFTPAAAAAFAWKVGAVHLGSKILNNTHAVLSEKVNRLNVSEGTRDKLAAGLAFGHGFGSLGLQVTADRFAVSGAGPDEPRENPGGTQYGTPDGQSSESRWSLYNPLNWW